MYEKPSEWYNVLLETHFNKYNELSCAKQIPNSILLIYFLKQISMSRGFKMKNRFTQQKSDKEESVDLSNMSPLESDEEVLEGQRLNILTSNNLFTRLPILLAQVQLKAIHTNENMKSGKYCIFGISMIKSSKTFETI